MSRKLDKTEAEALKKIGNCFYQLQEMEYAIDVFNKIGEYEDILKIYIETKNWSTAFAFIENHSEYESMLYMPYARWLIENDRFVEAQKGTLNGLFSASNRRWQE